MRRGYGIILLSGGIDIKPLNYHTARSSLDPHEANYNTRSLGRRGKLEMREVRGKEENNYCTLRHAILDIELTEPVS